MDLVDNWKIADDLPSRGTLVQNELGNFTLKVQAESAQGTGAFRQLAGPAERPRLTFDAKTGVEVPEVGTPLRLETNVGTAAPSPATFTESVKGPFSVAFKEDRIVMPGEFATHASSTGLGKVFTKPVDEIYANVYAVPKANRPPVETYMSKPAIDAHLAQFDNGASRFMTQSNLQKYGPAQADGTAFVMTRKQADKLLADAGGDAAKFEQALGLPANTLSTNPMVRVDFPRPRELNVRVPRGTEAGANSQWMPGGYLPSGQLEAVVDLGAAKPGAYTTTPVVTGAREASKTVASKLSFDSSLNTVDRSFSVKAGEILAADPVGSKSYARLQRQGTDVRFVHDPNMHAMGHFDAYQNSVTVNMLRHTSAREAASTIVHEATHQRGFYKGIPQNTQFTEYQAFRNESLFMSGRRPSLTERKNIWNDVKELYPDLPQGRNPFGGKE